MNRISPRWLAQSTIYRDSIDLLCVIDHGDKLGVFQPTDFVIKDQPKYAAVSEPTLALSPDSARSLMQALWDAGIRPNNGDGSGAEAKSMRSHIEFAERMADCLMQRLGGGIICEPKVKP